MPPATCLVPAPAAADTDQLQRCKQASGCGKWLVANVFVLGFVRQPDEPEHSDPPTSAGLPLELDSFGGNIEGQRGKSLLIMPHASLLCRGLTPVLSHSQFEVWTSRDFCHRPQHGRAASVYLAGGAAQKGSHSRHHGRQRLTHAPLVVKSKAEDMPPVLSHQSTVCCLQSRSHHKEAH
eukprot:scaffold264960_cov17-Tisochrysis_lutea.AAC.1